MTNSHSKPKDGKYDPTDEQKRRTAFHEDVQRWYISAHKMPIEWWTKNIQALIESQRTEAQLQLLDELESEILSSQEDLAHFLLGEFVTDKRQELTETGEGASNE